VTLGQSTEAFVWNPLVVPMYFVREQRSRASSRGATPVFGVSSRGTTYARTQLLRAADPVGKLVHAEVPHEHTPHPMQHRQSVPAWLGLRLCADTDAPVRPAPSLCARAAIARAGRTRLPRQVAALGPHGLLGALGLLAAAPLAEGAAAARAPAWDSVHA
jgi:hypothetical protein